MNGYCRSLLAAGALFLSSCGSIATIEEPVLDLDPPATLERESPGTEQSSSSSDDPARTQLTPETWWQHFEDPVLADLIEQGLASNPGLRIASRNVDAALARARIEGSNLEPQVGAGLSSSRRKQNFIGFPIPGTEGAILSSTSSNSSLSLNVSWEVDLWGRLRAQKAESYAELAATEADLEAAYLSLSGQIAKAYFGVVETLQQLELSERTLDSRERAERRVRARYERGLTSSLDTRLAKTQTANIAAQLAAQKQQYDFASRQLETLLGRYPARELELQPTLPEVPGPLPRGVPAFVVERRPDLRAAERRAFASSAGLKAAKRARYPSLSLTGATGTSSSELSDLLDGDFSVWSLAAGLLQPIFQGGRLDASVDLADAGVEISLALWLQTTLQAFLEVETSLEAEAFLDERLAALNEAAEQSQAAERLALDRYNNGLADYLSVLESQRSSFVSQAAYLDAKRQRLNARIDLILALGGDLSPSSSSESSSNDNPDAP